VVLKRNFYADSCVVFPRHSTLRHGVRRIRVQVSQQNALIEFPELTINPPQPVLQLDIVVRIEHGGTL
jgi:hypothetical protein